MKKRILVAMLATLCLLPTAALADDATGRGDLSATNQTLAAYVDGSGRLLIPGNDQAVTNAQADAVVAIDPYRVVFLSEDEAGTRALMALELSDMQSRVLANDVRAACMTEDGTLYYILCTDRTQLYALNLETNETTSYAFSEELDGLFVSAEGLVVTYVENAGAMLLSKITGQFESFGGSIPSDSTMTDDFQLYLVNGSELYLHRADANAADFVDANVYDYALLNGKVYYIANTGSAVRLKVYDPESMEWKVLGTPEITLESQLAASQSRLFALGDDQVVYTVDPETGMLSPFLTLDRNAYTEKLPSDGEWKIESFTIKAMSGRLAVYANLTEANDAPSFTFMEFTSDIYESDGRSILVESVALDDEENAWQMLEPAKLYSPLRRGQRGDAVREMQQPLYDLGYYDYYVDGIFGSRTERAIRLLQDDLGQTVDGIADEELQKLILSGTLSAYDPYRQVSYGDRGLRVQQMQQRLRELGYLADDADAIFGPRTQQAVQLFQRENGIAVGENATRDTLVALYSSGASHCSSYIDLRKGDTGDRVRELNKRLKELFYLTDSAASSYGSATVEAVKRFQSQNGLTITGEATSAVQQRLFAKSAPEYMGYISLSRGDENTRVERLQRRLSELGYFSGKTTGYFGKATQNAVKLFQQRAGLRPTGVADAAMQELLFSPDAPKYVKPTVIGQPVFTVDCYEKAEDGLYSLTDRCSANGYVTFSWQTEGDVESYNVVITDETGAKYLDQNTLLTMTGVSIDALTMDRTYTLTVTAYPQDGNSAHVTSATLHFKRIETPKEPDPVGTITEVSASVEPIVREENGVSYVRTGEITFRWYAVGDVESYQVEIHDSKGGRYLPTVTTDEQASVSTDAMVPDEVYTLYVYAIPTNGTIDDAKLATRAFALESQPDPIPSVTAPVVTVEGISPEVDGSYLLDESGATFRWNAVENADQYFIEIRDEANALFASETTTATGYVLSGSAMARGKLYTISITAIPVGGSVADGETTTVAIRIREDETIVSLDAPVLSIVGLQPSADGVVYSETNVPTFQWTAVNGATAYNVVVRDSSQNIISEDTVAELSYVFNGSALTRSAVYTVSVTAVPPEDANAQGTPATLPFIIRVQETPSAVPEATEVPAVTDAPETTEAPAATDVPEATEAPAVTTEPVETETHEATEAPVCNVGAPVLSIQPIVETVDDVSYVSEGMLQVSWPAEGDVEKYLVQIIESDDIVRTSDETTQTASGLSTERMAEGTIYTLRITAIPVGGTVEDGVSSEMKFALKVTSNEEASIPVEESVSTSTEEPAAEPVEEAAPAVVIDSTPVPTEEPTPVPTEEPTPIPTEEPTPVPTEEPTPIPTEEPTPVPTEEPTPVPTEEPTPEPIEVSAPIYPDDWTIPLDIDSDSALIEALQNRLTEWGWLQKDVFAAGQLDEVTLQAVVAFQNHCNETLALEQPLNVYSEENPLISAETLLLLMVPETETPILHPES